MYVIQVGDKQEFMADLRVLELVGCGIVLEVDWIRAVSPLTFDFNKLEVTMEIEGRRLSQPEGVIL